MIARRHLLKIAGALGLIAATPASAAIRTPKAQEGPFYPTRSMRFEDIDNDLVKVASKVVDAGGEIIELTGQVLDRKGTPIAGARVEIWQTDANARYLHTSDNANRPRDPDFQGFGHDITNENGAYRFRTIMPVAYPGRTPHIHMKVFSGRTELTTQLYLKDDAQNGRDSTYRRLSAEEREAVTMYFDATGDVPVTSVNIVL